MPACNSCDRPVVNRDKSLCIVDFSRNASIGYVDEPREDQNFKDLTT